MNFLLSSFYLVFCWFGSGFDFDFGFGTFVEREKNKTKRGHRAEGASIKRTSNNMSVR